jgi:peptidylprolyl isomerase
MLRRPLATRRAAALAAVALTMTLAACGSSDDDDAASDSSGATTVDSATDDTVTDITLVPATPPASVPDVSLPASIPTELVVTELSPGTGDEAVDGQIVVVDYVGVRSEDGAQFDASYGRGPIAVALGAGGVIAGWDQGLVGTKVGERVQLDIPAELAYGDSPRGDVIQAGDALTFVIDVRSIVPGEPPADTDVPISAEAVTAVATDDVRPGTGDALALGDTGLFHLVAARGDDGTILTSSWVDGQAQPLPIDAEGLLPGLAEGLVGMQVGGRRVITLPYDSSLGLTPETDTVIIADLLAIY